MAEELRVRIVTLGDKIRLLKANLKDGGLKSDAINNDACVQALVKELRDLKAQLDDSDELSEKAFADRQRKEQEVKDKQRKALHDAQSKQLQAAERSLPTPLVQRKIFHLFRYAGVGATFRYDPPPRLNSEQTGFGRGTDPHPSVYVTEKWDGTTMQASSRAIYKRIDLHGKRLPSDPSARYAVRLIAWREQHVWKGLDFFEADARVHEALAPYLRKLEFLDDDLCVYFEVVHTRINATYRDLEGFADIRVFDFARIGASGWKDAAFLPFDETVELAARFQLPLVGWEKLEKLDAATVWSFLEEVARGRQYSTAAAPLEGYVVREAAGARVAKARVDEFKVGMAHGPSDATTIAAVASSRPKDASTIVAPPSTVSSDDVSAEYLLRIGLLPPGFVEGSVDYHLLSRARDR